MFQVAIFGGKDVTASLLQAPPQNFKVSIQFFGDPKPNVYKFLKLSNENDHVFVGENEVIANLHTAIDNLPVCRKLIPLQQFVQHKKSLFFAGSLPPIVPIQKYALSLDILYSFENQTTNKWNHVCNIPSNEYEFIYCGDTICSVTNPLKLVLEIHRVLKNEGIAVFAVANNANATPFSLEDLRVAKNECNDIIEKKHLKTKFDIHSLRLIVKETDFDIFQTQNFCNTIILVCQKKKQTEIVDEKHLDKKLEELPVAFHFGSDVKMCPHCGEAFWKDERCSFMFCGLGEDGIFRVGYGCGRSFCFECGKKYCGYHYDKLTGKKLPFFTEQHNSTCCQTENGFRKEDYCPGGHSSHCAQRW